jgi:hypothetical protein
MKKEIESLAKKIYKKNNWDKLSKNKKFFKKSLFCLEIRRFKKNTKVMITPLFKDTMGETRTFFGEGKTEKKALKQLKRRLKREVKQFSQN